MPGRFHRVQDWRTEGLVPGIVAIGMFDDMDVRKHFTQECFMLRVLLLISFDELHLHVQNVWAKYILVNGIFSLVMFG